MDPLNLYPKYKPPFFENEMEVYDYGNFRENFKFVGVGNDMKFLNVRNEAI